MFYRIKALHDAGIKIYLHCFEYGRGESEEVKNYCESVVYYKRKRNVSLFNLRLPFIVSSRINPLLVENLSKDDFPVLLEGIHCTYYLYNGHLYNRKVLVRLHNVEFEYYYQLCLSTKNIFKKFYYSIESRILKKYEGWIAAKAKLVAISEKDKEVYQNIFGAKDVEVLPAFLPNDKVTSKTGKGDFCLYHGNLSVAENEKAVLWFLNVFSGMDFQLIIAGKNPSKFLKGQIEKNKNTELIQNPSKEKMDELVCNAHIHLIPSFNSTGIKIKLLNALFNGRFVIVNTATVAGTGLESLCIISNNEEEFKRKIEELITVSFTQNEIEKRKEILESIFNKEKNAHKLIRLL
ncbi:MAG: glycosyltransferase [Ginsengibacter sp.]